jgi:4a-hydroxytetrahydrobiopterin dehydratase
MKKLNKNEVLERMISIDREWKLKEDHIQRVVILDDFKSAFSFMTSVAFIAELNNHHPNWTNVYNKVSISLSTHEAGGLTEKDFDMAKEIDLLIEK